jgi:Zn-dependent protease
MVSGEPEPVAEFASRLDEYCERYCEVLKPPEAVKILPLPVAEPPPKDLPAGPPNTTPQDRVVPIYAPGSRLPKLDPADNDRPNPKSVIGLILAAVGLLPIYGVAPATMGCLLAFLGMKQSQEEDARLNRKLFWISLLLAILSWVVFLARLAFHRIGLSVAPAELLRRMIVEVDGNEYAGIAVTLIVIVFSLSWHESAHALTALWNGDPTARDLGRITLNPIAHIDPFGSVIIPLFLLWSSHGNFYFGYAKPVMTRPTRYRNIRLGEFTVSFGGPGTNLLLVIASLSVFFLVFCSVGLFHRLTGVDTSGSVVLHYVVYFALVMIRVNVFLAALNLLPIPPLDGYHVLQSILPVGFGQIIRPIERYGFLFLMILIYTHALDGVFSVVNTVSEILVKHYLGLLVPGGF